MTSRAPRHLAAGALLTTGGAWLGYVASFALGIAVARTAGPAAIGDYALAVAISEAANALTSVPFAIALVRESDLDEARWDTVVATLALVGGAVALALLAVAGGLAAIDRPRAATYLAVLAASRVPSFVAIASLSWLARRLRYARSAALSAIATLGGNVVGAAVLLAGGGGLALAVRDVAVAVTLCLAALVAVPATRAIAWSAQAMRAHLARTRGVWGSNALDIALERGDRLVVALALPGAPAGWYQQARALCDLPLLAARPLAQIVLGVTSRVRETRDPWLGAVAAQVLLARAMLPVAVGLLVLGDRLVLALLGPDWAGAVPLVRVLAVGALVGPVLEQAKQVLYATARPRLALAARFVHVAAVVAGLAWTIVTGTPTAAAAGFVLGAVLAYAVIVGAGARGAALRSLGRLLALPALECAAAVAILQHDRARTLPLVPAAVAVVVVSWGLVALLEGRHLVHQLRALARVTRSAARAPAVERGAVGVPAEATPAHGGAA